MYENQDHIFELERDLERFQWNDLEEKLPTIGELIICTDGEARWMDMLVATHWELPGYGLRWQEHVATHWHAVQEIPDSIKKKPKPVEPEIKF